MEAGRPPLLVVCGATATGKTAVAQWIAERIGAAVVSADSMLVYRGMDIGTAKPTPAERGSVTYIGLDCVEPAEPFSTGDWLVRVMAGLAALPEGTPVVVAGGTGLYIRAFLHGLDAAPSDPSLRARFTALYEAGGLDALAAEVVARGVEVPEGDRRNPRRLIRALERSEAARVSGGARSPGAHIAAAACPDSPPPCGVGSPQACLGGRGGGPPPPRPLPPAVAALRLPPSFTPRICCLAMARDQLAVRIRRRIEKMFADGLVEEALRCFGDAPDGAPTASGAIGYAEAMAYHRGEIGREEAVARIAARTRRLAKRQETWFRHQLVARWITVSPDETPQSVAMRLLAQ